MKKIQVLFPEPQMRRLREAAKREDRSISEIVRRATEAWLDRLPKERPAPGRAKVPVFRGGAVKVRPDRLRELAYLDRIAGAASGDGEAS